MMLTGRSSVFDVNLVQTLTKLYKKFCGVRLILPLYFSRAPCLKRWRQKKKEGFLSFSAHVASSLWSECTFHKPFLSAADTLSCSLCLIETHTLENTRISTCLSLNRPVFSALLLHISIPASFSLRWWELCLTKDRSLPHFSNLIVTFVGLRARFELCVRGIWHTDGSELCFLFALLTLKTDSLEMPFLCVRKCL